MLRQLSVWGMPLLAVLLLGCWFVYSFPSKPNVAQGPTSYYVYNNGDPNDPFEGDQFFGSQDQVGVSKDVEDALPAHQTDFLTIGGDNAARNSFLTNAGHNFETPPNTWDVVIDRTGTVNGETRLAVAATLGKNETVNGGTSLYAEAELYEIWKIAAGNVPVLLERTEQWHDGVFTTTESPTDDGLSWPAGITGGSAPDDMGL